MCARVCCSHTHARLRAGGDRREGEAEVRTEPAFRARTFCVWDQRTYKGKRGPPREEGQLLVGYPAGSASRKCRLHAIRDDMRRVSSPLPTQVLPRGRAAPPIVVVRGGFEYSLSISRVIVERVFVQTPNPSPSPDVIRRTEPTFRSTVLSYSFHRIDVGDRCLTARRG